MSLNAKNVIKNYLDGMAKKDESFAKAYANKEKNIDSCFKYILEMARKKGTSVCMTDEEVFGLAVHYYVEGDLKEIKMPTDFKEVKTQDAKPKEIKPKGNPKKTAKKQENTGMGYLFDF